MQEPRTKKYIKMISVLCIGVCFLVLVNTGKGYAMELNQNEREREEICHSIIAEYEMNIILHILDIKKWNEPPYAFDEMNLPIDEPLGIYSEQALEEYLKSNMKIIVEIEYYFGGHRPLKPEYKFPIQVIKIYENDRLYRLGYTMWGRWGNGIMAFDFNMLNQTELEESRLIKEKTGKQQPTTNKTAVTQQAGEFKEQYKGDTILSLENIEEVMETFMMIKDGDGLYKLTELPLTESFYSKCREEFPHIENAESMKGFWLYFWGVGEDNKLICMCIVSPYTDDRSQYVDEHYTYLVEMQLKDKQIDSMDITLLRHYLPEEK